MANIVGDFDSFLAFVLSVPLGEIEIVFYTHLLQKMEKWFSLGGNGFWDEIASRPIFCCIKLLNERHGTETLIVAHMCKS